MIPDGQDLEKSVSRIKACLGLKRVWTRPTQPMSEACLGLMRIAPAHVVFERRQKMFVTYVKHCLTHAFQHVSNAYIQHNSTCLMDVYKIFLLYVTYIKACLKDIQPMSIAYPRHEFAKWTEPRRVFKQTREDRGQKNFD